MNARPEVTLTEAEIEQRCRTEKISYEHYTREGVERIVADRLAALGQVEYAVEVTWVDWKKAGAQGPTSQFGPFDDMEQTKVFLDRQRMDRAVTHTRVMHRRASYGRWSGLTELAVTTETEREDLFEMLFEGRMPLCRVEHDDWTGTHRWTTGCPPRG